MSAHRAFELAVNELRKNIRMNLAILRGLVGLQLVSIVVMCIMITPKNPQTMTSPPLASYKMVIGLSFAIYLLWPVIVYRFQRRSRSWFKEKVKRGAVLIEASDLQQQLPPGSLPLSEHITLPDDFETTHVFVGGATGTGKTQGISGVITKLRKRQAKAVIYDAKDGEFVAKFFDPKRDLIFNPFDARSLAWNVFDVITAEPDFDSLAVSIVPANSIKDMFFTTAARDVLSGILRHCFVNNLRSNENIWQALNKPLKQLHKILVDVNSPAASAIENTNSPQSQGVISTCLQYAKVFKYLSNPEDKPLFSLKQWLENDKGGGFIYLSSNTKQRQTLKGIFSLFINSLANEILSLRDNPKRRIFIIVDEFGTLHRLDSIKDLLALGRSKGCSFWLGIQEKAQLDAIYGKELANSIINQCNNYCIFRMNDADSAEYFSRLFGEKESELMESTFSSGARDYRDSESYRNLRFTDKLLLPSQIQSLPNLSCLIKLSGFPLTLSEVSYRHYPDRGESFVANKHFLIEDMSSKKAVPDSAKRIKRPRKTDKTSTGFTDDDITDFNF